MTLPQHSELAVKIDYKEIFDSFPGLSLVVLPDDSCFTIVAANNAFLKQTKTQQKNILGQALFDVFPSDPNDPHSTSKETVISAMRKVIEDKTTNQIVNVKYSIPNPEKVGTFEDQYWSVAFAPIFNSNGDITHIALQVENVTEAILLKSRETEAAHLSLALEAGELGIWTIDLKTNQTWRSPRHAEIFGYPDLSSGWSFSKFLSHVVEEDRADIESKFKYFIENKMPWFYECRIQKCDGTIRWIEVGAKYLQRPGGGILLTGLVKDITEIKETEEYLKRSMEEFRLLAEAMPQIVWVNRADGWNIYLNQQWMDYTGLTMEESSGHGWNKPVHPDDQQRTWEAWQNATKEGSNYSLECRLRRTDGVYKWWLVRALPVLDSNGKVLKWFGTCTDIEELKQSEVILKMAKDTAEESARFRSEFLDIAAHELRTPVTSISLLLQLTQRQMDKGQALTKDFLTRLKGPVERLTHLVSDLLDVSRLERGLVVLSPIRCDIVSLVSSCLQELQIQSQSRPFIFEKPNDPIELDIDPSRIQQVIANLLDNALKYTPEDSLITVKVERNTDTVRVSVIDQGPGIQEKQLEKIFDSFTRGKSDQVTRVSGLGLGLDIGRRIIEQHNGKIGVVSEPGKGSTFFIDLPFKVDFSTIL